MVVIEEQLEKYGPWLGLLQWPGGGDRITGAPAVMSHDLSKIPRDHWVMVISFYAPWTCFGSTQLANYHQVLMACYSGLYCPSKHSDIIANEMENHIKHLSSKQ